MAPDLNSSCEDFWIAAINSGLNGLPDSDSFVALMIIMKRMVGSFYLLAHSSDSERTRVSHSRSSGVNVSPNSSISKIWRSSIVQPSKGAFLIHSMASSLEFTFQIQYPAM